MLRSRLLGVRSAIGGSSKRFLQRSLRTLGYDVRRVGTLTETTPAWIPSTDAFPYTERMANRSYRPPRRPYELTQRDGDRRLRYLLYFLDLRGLRVLELGPRIGHHSVMLEKLGVRETVSIEGQRQNFEECLRTKARYGLDRTTFYLADIEELAAGNREPPFEGGFDLVFCAGLLYHLPEPAPALEWFRQQAGTLFLQTHYVEQAALDRYWPEQFSESTYRHRGHEYRVKIFREERGNPRSGLSAISLWAYEEDLLAMIERAGFAHVSVLGKDVHGGLPHITVLAES